jgi:hypothetical protein
VIDRSRRITTFDRHILIPDLWSLFQIDITPADRANPAQATTNG